MAETETESRPKRREKVLMDQLNDMSVADLRELATAVAAKIEEKTNSEMDAIRAEMEERLKRLGKSTRDLFGSAPTPQRKPKADGRKEGSRVAVKYRHGDETWSGRGRTPKWITALEAEGRKREECLVGG